MSHINLLSDVNESYCNFFGDVNEKVFFSDVNEQGKWQLVMLMDTGIILQWQSVMLMDKGILIGDVIWTTDFLVMLMDEGTSQTQIWLILNKMTKLKETDLSVANQTSSLR